MANEEDLGIYCLNNKTFYYMETGNVMVKNTVSRIKNTLIQKGLIEFDGINFMNTHDYKVVKIKEARLAEYAMEPIYISQHVKEVVLNEQEATETGGGLWKKR